MDRRHPYERGPSTWLRALVLGLTLGVFPGVLGAQALEDAAPVLGMVGASVQGAPDGSPDQDVLGGDAALEAPAQPPAQAPDPTRFGQVEALLGGLFGGKKEPPPKAPPEWTFTPYEGDRRYLASETEDRAFDPTLDMPSFRNCGNTYNRGGNCAGIDAMVGHRFRENLDGDARLMAQTRASREARSDAQWEASRWMSTRTELPEAEITSQRESAQAQNLVDRVRDNPHRYAEVFFTAERGGPHALMVYDRPERGSLQGPDGESYENVVSFKVADSNLPYFDEETGAPQARPDFRVNYVPTQRGEDSSGRGAWTFSGDLTDEWERRALEHYQSGQWIEGNNVWSVPERSAPDSGYRPQAIPRDPRQAAEQRENSVWKTNELFPLPQ